MKKRLIALVSVLLVMSMMLAACGDGGSSASVATGDSSTGGSSAATGEPAAGKITLSGYAFNTEPVTLTVWVDWPQAFGEWGDDLVTQWITETVGVTLDTQYATTNTSEELNLMLVSGEQLPDLIVTAGGSAVANTMVREGYVSALDELAAEHFPGFTDLLPDQMYEIYQEDDGHLYRTADWFADTARLEALVAERGDKVQMSGGNQTILLNRQYWEEVGSPAVDNLEGLRAYLLAAKDAHPEITLPFVLANVSWGDSQDSVNFFYRLHGGQDWLYEDGGNIALCLNDPAYKEALKYMNQLYRDGIFTKETFTISTETFESTLAAGDTFAYSGQDFNWFGKVTGGDQMDSIVMPILAPMAEGVSRDDLLLKNGDTASIGGSTAVFVSENSENAARAIEYLAFKYTDESQTAERFGIEGVTWEYDTDGTILWTQEYQDAIANTDWYQMSLKYGCNNGAHSWFCTNYICKLESPESDYPVRAYNGQIHRDYLKSERIYDLSKIIKDDDAQMKYDQFLMLAGESIVKCLQANSDADFEAAFTEYLTTAENMGMADLEAYFTENYEKWVERGLG